MKHIAQGTFLGGAGELGLGALPLEDWRLESVSKNVRSAVLFIPQKLLGIHKKQELSEVVSALGPHMSPAERGGMEGVEYRIPLPRLDLADDWDAVHIVLGREAVAAAATFHETPRVRAVPFPLGYSASPFPSGFQCSLIIRRKGDWQSIFLASGYFENGDPLFQPTSVRRGQILTHLNGADLADSGVRELEHFDWIAFRNRDEKADLGVANKLLYMESSNFTFAEGMRTSLLLLDAEPFRSAASLGSAASPVQWMRRSDCFRIAGKSIGYGGYAIDGAGIAASNSCILIGADETRLRKELESGPYSGGEALLLPFRDRGVSGLHCRIFIDGGSFQVEDLGSTNGTWCHDGSDYARLESVTKLEKSKVLALGGIQLKLLVP